ncbi:histidine kinase [Actinoplanes sp. NBRC 101535]|uniref:sensor histidine kinase n=1 Tax=Actinoplanes sp. NBRC 101535 TaxID=3032196 RepID=UPI0024A1D7B6|nr:histidine kinase [Actinoplanes sp. NBRC 101535]GLY00428.1 hypothetical protein Acsp01_08070 [Actinoplanes sp. NBRC 101535]
MRPVRRLAEMVWRDDPETGRLVRVVVSGLLVWALAVLAPAGVRPVLGAALAGWVLFLVADRRWPRAARAGLAAAALVSATVAAVPDETAALLFLYTTLFTFVLLPRTPWWPVVALAVTVLAVLLAGLGLAGRGAGEIAGQAALIVVLVLFNLHRREHRMRADEALRSREAQARAAALDERARIARELHDVLAHSLGALGVQLEVAEAELTERNDVAGAAARIRRARILAGDGLVEARSAVAALRDDVPPLARALADLVEAHRTDHAAAVTLRVEGAPRRLSSGAEVSLLRTAREALTNAGRHAPGAPVTVVLDLRGPKARLTVGNPLRDPVPLRFGYGLSGARERLALVGGTLEAGPAGDGWTVVAEVPA